MFHSVQYYTRSAQSKYQVQTGARRTPHLKIQAKSNSTQRTIEREIGSIGCVLCRVSKASGENVTQGHGLRLRNGRPEVSSIIQMLSTVKFSHLLLIIYYLNQSLGSKELRGLTQTWKKV